MPQLLVHAGSFNLTAYVVAVIFVATLVRSTLGFGEALVAVPLLALRTPVQVAAPLAVLVSIVVAGVVGVQDRRVIEFRAAAGLILSSLFRIPLGLLALTRADDHVVKLLLGSVIVPFAIYSIVMGITERCLMITSLADGGGLLSGILGGPNG